VKVYISGSLISVKDREKAHQFYEFLANLCKEEGHEPYLPHQNSDPILHKHLTPEQVFDKDFHNLLNSDLILASLNEPSTGVGAEIGISLKKGIEIFAIYNKESNPSRFILGLLSRSDKAKIFVYENLAECKIILKNNLNALSKKLLIS
jgi:nucleoside 2-deoxyribosyltransferase